MFPYKIRNIPWRWLTINSNYKINNLKNSDICPEMIFPNQLITIKEAMNILSMYVNQKLYANGNYIIIYNIFEL